MPVDRTPPQKEQSSPSASKLRAVQSRRKGEKQQDEANEASDEEFPEETLESQMSYYRRSLAMHYSYLTRFTAKANMLLDTISQSKEYMDSNHFLGELLTIKAEIEAQQEKITENTAHFTALDLTEDHRNATTSQCQENIDSSDRLLQRVHQAISTMEAKVMARSTSSSDWAAPTAPEAAAAPQSSAVQASTAPPMGTPTSLPRTKTAFQPDKIGTEAILQQFDIWQQSYEAYYDSSSMHVYSLPAQHSVFAKCVDEDLMIKICMDSNPPTPIKGPRGLLAITRRIIQELNPEHVRRQEVFANNQGQNQLYSAPST